MGSCTRRHFLLSICVLQLLTIIERQVFDFLGYMWAPILANFFHIIFVIFGFFGAYQLRAKYLITYSVWNVLWIGWNVFLICFYLNVGVLDRDSDILNIGTGSVSWFEVNGFGCKPVYPTNITSEDPYRPVRPESVDGCVLDYFTIEIIHAAVQLLFTVLGLIGAIFVSRIFLDEDDRLSRGNSSKSKSKHRQSLYSIEFSPPVDTIRGHPDDMLDFQNGDHSATQLSPKPMTPRRVKRRSVMTRGTTNRQSSQSRRSSNNRTSQRASRRKFQQNPVTKLMEQQQGTISKKPPPQQFQHFEHNKLPSLTVNNLKTLNHDVISIPRNNNNFHHNHQSSHHQSPGSNSFQQINNSNGSNINPDPIYYNMSASTTLLQQSWNTNTTNSTPQGHFNPTYQHSTPDLNHSPEVHDEMYNNRPPSVRSSYSNFHGTRPLSSYNPSAGAENVFAGFNGQQAAGGGGGNSSGAGGAAAQPQAIPQVPQRRVASRESVRSMAFLNSGPPAYNLNYHTPPDSETTM